MRRGRRGGKTTAMAPAERSPKMNLPRIQREFAGLWVALKRGEVVEACTTPYELIAALHSKSIRDTTIIRVPGLDESELVGLG